MPNITTKIHAVASQTSKKGKEYWVVDTDAGKMSSFEYDDVVPLKEWVGKTVTIEYEISGDKGQYKNFVSFSAPTSAETFSASLDERNTGGEQERNRLIVKQSSLKAAIEYNAQGTLGKIDDILRDAEIFLNWVMK